MNKLVLASLFALFSWAPVSPGKRYVITHYNITFAPDLSNRVNPNLYKRPMDDMLLLKVITNSLYPSIIKSKRSQNQKDKFQVDFVNKGLITQYHVRTEKLALDIAKFDQLKRIQYLTNNPLAKPTFRQDVDKLTAEFNRIYKSAIQDNSGADIWTYLDQGINANHVLEDEKPSEVDGIPCLNQYRNVLILPTDGYIETNLTGAGFNLSQQTINGFRKAFLASGEESLDVFFKKNKAFHLKPSHNPYLKKLEILVLELYDRSLTRSGSATTHPTDLEIIKLFWSDWLKASGVKHFELQPCANSSTQAERIILNFLGVTKINS